MKRSLLVVFLVFIGTLVITSHAVAQHFISIQSDDKQPFAIQVNGTGFNSSKTGSLRIANLSGGSYNLSITPASKKYPPQNFVCVIDKADVSYTLVNVAKKGWVLKNTKSPEVLASSTVAQPAQGSAQGDLNSPFAKMLAEVINDPDLLKATPWVLTTKVEGSDTQDMQSSIAEQQQEQDTSTYVAETKGIIKAAEHDTKNGTEMVFVDFDKNGGDTIHVLIPPVDGSDNNNNATTQQTTPPVANNTGDANKDTSIATQHTAQTEAINNKQKTDTTAIVQKKTEELPFDTSSNKQITNPFFAKETPAKTSNNTPAAVDTANPVVDHSQPAQKTDNTSILAVTENKPATDEVKATVKADCKKMLSDNDEEKLKHKIYLETQDDKILSLTKKALAGKCINTAQVKELLSFFLSDDARYNFLFTVYPFVYDIGNFNSLETFMIDHKYKDMFEAMIK